MPFVAIYINWAFIIFIIIGTWHLLTSVDALHFQPLRDISPQLLLQSYNYYYMTLFLFIGLMWVFYKEKMVDGSRSLFINTKDIIAKEIKIQIRGE